MNLAENQTVSALLLLHCLVSHRPTLEAFLGFLHEYHYLILANDLWQ